MGMFDSLHNARPHTGETEWQTKAYSCNLDNYDIGDEMPDVHGYDHIQTYQVEVLGGPDNEDSFATISCGVLAAVPSERDPSLPLFNYSGHLVSAGAR